MFGLCWAFWGGMMGLYWASWGATLHSVYLTETFGLYSLTCYSTAHYLEYWICWSARQYRRRRKPVVGQIPVLARGYPHQGESRVTSRKVGATWPRLPGEAKDLFSQWVSIYPVGCWSCVVMPVVFAGSLSILWLPPPNKNIRLPPVGICIPMSWQAIAQWKWHVPNNFAFCCCYQRSHSHGWLVFEPPRGAASHLPFRWPCLHWAVRAKEGDSEDGLRRACGLSLQVSMNANHFQSYSIIIKFSLFTSWQSLLPNDSSIRHSHITLPKHRTALRLLDFAPWPVNFEPAGLLGGRRLVWSEGPKTSRCWWTHPLMPFCWSTPATLAFDVQSWASGVGSLPPRRLVVGCGDIGVDDRIVCW